MSEYIVGVTGGIASGKTTVTDLFSDLGVDVIDADIIARQVVEPETVAFNKIKKHFGKQVVDGKGNLNRAWLRKHVFADPSEKEWLNQLLHPIIRQEMQVQCQQATSDYCILCAPLLIENKLVHLVKRVLVVDVPPDIQLQRAINRDGSAEKTIQQIIEAQCERETRLAAADDVIDNSNDEASIVAQVKTLHAQYLKYAST
ncbi:dephospho-CoA kinase [Agaribacter flavus]|uniref:Dephospho-CoA kinase n=1 Tax=Agaribacter flavus TaxID=1902781 RepID=A0ABV7FR23_9ALTE